MWLQYEGAPDAADGGLAQSGFAGQHAAGPVRNPLRGFLQRQPHNLFDLLVTDLTRRSWTRLITQTNYSFGNETIAPETHRKPSGAQLCRDRCIVGSSCALQNNSRTKRHRPGTARLPRNALQFGLLRR